jgi:hypothetical protein
MEMFSKKNGACRYFLPKADFQVKQNVRRGPVFFESEPVDLSAYLVCRRHGISHGGSVLEYVFMRDIAHKIVCAHVSGRVDIFGM